MPAEVENLKEAVRAHLTQNRMLASEIRRLEADKKFVEENKNETIHALLSRLDEARLEYQNLREKLLGSTSAEGYPIMSCHLPHSLAHSPFYDSFYQFSISCVPTHFLPFSISSLPTHSPPFSISSPLTHSLSFSSPATCWWSPRPFLFSLTKGDTYRSWRWTIWISRKSASYLWQWVWNSIAACRDCWATQILSLCMKGQWTKEYLSRTGPPSLPQSYLFVSGIWKEGVVIGLYLIPPLGIRNSGCNNKQNNMIRFSIWCFLVQKKEMSVWWVI